MLLANLSKPELKALLVDSVDAWLPGASRQLNPLDIFRHWRGRPQDASAKSMITMLESARVAWRLSKHSADAFDDVRSEATRLLKLSTFRNTFSKDYLADGFKIAKALAHVCMAASYWTDPKNPGNHAVASDHLAQAAKFYDDCWPLGLLPYVDLDSFNKFSTELPERDQLPDSITALLYLAFGPMCPSPKMDITGTTYMILFELLSYIMGHRREGSKTQMRGLFVGPDWRDREQALGRVLNITVRRLPAPVTSFYLDPVALGVTLIDHRMRKSLRAAWRCCLYDLPDNSVFSLRVEVDLNNQPVSFLAGGSAGGLLAAMMCAARDEIELSTNLSATCILKLSKQERKCKDSIPLDPHRVLLGPIQGTIPKLREAWLGHGVDEVYLHQQNYEEWERSRHSGPQANPAANLAELVTVLNRDEPHWDKLKKAAKNGHSRWKGIIAHQGKPRGGPDERHRLDLYVPPLLRVEGEPDPYHYAIEDRLESQALLVPGAELSDEPLVHLLALALGETAEVDWNLWNAANRQNKEGQDDDEFDVDQAEGRLEEGTDRDDQESDSTSSKTTIPSWLSPGRDLLIYDVAGAGKSVLTLKIEHLLNNDQRWQEIFGTKQPTLVVRIEGEWSMRNGNYLPLREMVFETIVRQLEHPNATETRTLRETEKSELRAAMNFAFTKRRLVLIVDGFDQFSSLARDHIVAEHESDDGRDCRWIIASRQHTIAKLFGVSRRKHDWMRVRIEPFNERQRDEFFRLAGLADIWQQYVNPQSQAMAEMLQLPVVLDQIREFIENRMEAAKKSGRTLEPVEFESLSQLALVTSRLSLERALDPQKLKGHRPPDHLKDSPREQLEAVEQILSLVAFEMLLQAQGGSDEAWNGRIRGKNKKRAFLEACQDRYHRPVDLQLHQLNDKTRTPELTDDRKRESLKEENAQNKQTWAWAMLVLDAIVLNHRTYMEQQADDILAFRDRKSAEFYAARYLTRYANEWDIFADYSEDKRSIEQGDVACVWQRIADPQWSNIWNLAIDMPQEPLPGTTEYTYLGAVMDPWPSCLSLSALFRPTLDGNVRPTKLLWRCWPLFEFEPSRALDGRYRFDGKLVTGHQLVAQGLEQELTAMAQKQLLCDRDDATRVCDARQRCLEMFRQSSRELVKEFEARMDMVLLDDGTRQKIPVDSNLRKTILSQWKNQSSHEKSLTFLQCPPQTWIDAYKSDPNAMHNPCVNPAISGHETFEFRPIWMQATTVTRWQYRQFDPAYEAWSEVSKRVRERASAFGKHPSDDDFPIICTDWFDAWVFTKWLGADYCLPNEWVWEHAARSGTTTDFHFGEGCNGSQCNCDGNYPDGTGPGGQKLAEPPDLARTTPVGCADYLCSPWGLWDVHGNLWEWCENWYDAEEGSFRVNRGGCWSDAARNCRSGNRNRNSPGNRDFNLGFRVALVPSGKASQSSPASQQPPGT